MTASEEEAINALLEFTATAPGFHPAVDFDAMDRMYVAARKVREDRVRSADACHRGA